MSIRHMSRKRDQTDSTAISDTDLVARASQGEVQAFGDLYERYLDEIYRFIYYRVMDEDEAEDMTETAFLKAWEALPKTNRPVENFRAWMYRIAHNLVIDRHRTRKITVPLEHAVGVRDVQPMPERVAQNREESTELAQKMSELQPRHQQVLLCRFVNGLSHAETAQVMGLKENHVRVLQYRALKEIRQLLTEDLLPA